MPPKGKGRGNTPPEEAAEPKDPNALDYAPRSRGFKVTITTILEGEPGLLKNPTIRYNFWGQRREVTGELCDGKGGWKEVDLGGGRKAWQWEKAYEPVNIDKEWALTLNKNPLLLFTLADKAEGELATSVPPRASLAVQAGGAPAAPSKGGRKGSAGALGPPPQGRNFLFTAVLDTSALLAGDGGSSVSQTWDRAAAADHPSAVGSALPAGLGYLRVEVASDKPDSPVLSSGLLHDLNPLTLRLRDLKKLPGLMLDTLPQQKYLQPDKFHLLNRLCRPVYAAVWPFDDADLFPRLVRTQGMPNQTNVKWDLKVVYLTGHLDRHRLEDRIQNGLLHVQIHDRDPLPSSPPSNDSGGNKDRMRRWERMVAGGYTMDTKANEFVEDEEAAIAGGADPDQLKVVPAMSVFDVDDAILKEWESDVQRARDKCLHGVATIPLSVLLTDQSRQLSSAFARNKITDPFARPACDERPRLKGRYDVVAQKSRRKPKGGTEMEEWDLSAEERLVRHEVGKYLEAGCTLGVEVWLQRPLRTLQEGDAEGTGPATEPLALFGRAAFMFEYENAKMLKELLAAIDKVNKACLPNLVGSLRSYELTDEEVAAADRGELDVVCGFQLIDDDCRTIVIEGRGDSGLAKVMAQVPRVKRNDEGYRVLYHPKVRFTDRLYTRFNVDLKKIRLRYPLPTLCVMPEVYDRAKIPVEFFEALQRLNQLRQVGRLSHAQHYGLFPPRDVLGKVESRYGETITNQDISGDASPRRVSRRRSAQHSARGDVASALTSHNNQQEAGEGASLLSPTSQRRLRSAAEKRKGSTHCVNPEFLEALKHRQAVDYLSLRKHESEEARAAYEQYRQRRLQEDAKDPVPATFQYGSQKLHYVELKKAAIRKTLCKRRAEAVYTYSNDYMSLNFPLVDEFRIRQDEAARSKAAWLTQEGFVWPVPKAPSELNVHPQKPSEQRINDLKETWIENQLHPQPVSRNTQDLAPGQKDFYNYAIAAGKVFGGYERPEFDRDYDSSKVGDPERLPRGRMVLRTNPDFYRSVHLGGVENMKLMKEAAQKEKADWLAGVVVDSLDFKVTKMVVKDRPQQLDRTTDILNDPPKKRAFKKVRNAHLPSGKLVKLEPAPISVFAQDPFADIADFASTFRAVEPDSFLVRQPETNEPVGFISALHRDLGKPRSQTIMCRRKHPPVPASEKTGPKWER